MKRFFVLLLILILSGCSLKGNTEPQTEAGVEPVRPPYETESHEYIVVGMRGEDQGIYAIDAKNGNIHKEIYKGGYTSLDAISDRLLIYKGAEDSKDSFEGEESFIICDYKGNILKKITPSPGVYEGVKPVISPDGKRIVYIGNSGGLRSVYHVEVESGNIIKLEDISWKIKNLSFIDKDTIMYSRGNYIYKNNLRYNREEKILDSQYSNSSPSISKDGTRLAFQGYNSDSGRTLLYISNLGFDVENRRGIYEGKIAEGSIRWSRDNRNLAFILKDGSSNTVKLFDFDVFEARSIPGAYDVIFSPDNKYLAYSVYGEDGILSIYKRMIRGDNPVKLYEKEVKGALGKSMELLIWLGEM